MRQPWTGTFSSSGAMLRLTTFITKLKSPKFTAPLMNTAAEVAVVHVAVTTTSP